MVKAFYILASVMLLVLSSTVAFSQEKARNDSKTFSYGLKAGLNYSTITAGERAQAKSAAVFGGFGAIRFNSTWGISVDLLYSRQGCEVSQTVDAAVVLDYLKIPLLVNYYVKQAEGLTVKVGFQPGFLLSSSMEEGGFSYEKGIQSADYSIPIGIAYEFGFGLLLDARFNLGLSNVFDGSERHEPFNKLSSGSNMVFQFTVGYRF